MAGLTPPNDGGAATEADAHELAGEQLRTYLYICAQFLPALPDFDNGGLTALPASDGVDRVSLLPDALLRNIISRLHVTDAACTALLSSRWRRVWLSTPLSLIDAYLRPSGNSPDIAAVVSRILEAHLGPFRCVHLVCSVMDACQSQPARWLELLAAKGVEELVLVGRPCTSKVPFPAKLFSVTTLGRLYIALWEFPDVATLPRGSFFPNLRELGICSVVMNGADVEAIVARSPALEILSIQGSNKGLRVRLVSRSLRCLQICGSVVENIAVVRAPHLDRLIVETPRDKGGLYTKVTIGDSPKLQALGILEPGNHVLEIRGIIVVAGMKASPSTMVLHLKVLSLDVRFANPHDVEMVPSFLRCFPNLEKLHVTSRKCDYEAGSAKFNLDFWKSAKATENVIACIKGMSFCEFRGEIGEVAFLKFFFSNARVLESATITMANVMFMSVSTKAVFSAAKQACSKMASKSCKLVVLGSDDPEGGKCWSFKRGTDYSFEDPFSPVEWSSEA